MIHGFGGFLLLLGAGWGCGCCGGCRAGDGAGFKCVIFCHPIKMQIKILNSIKTKSTLSLCRKSRCLAGIFAVASNVFGSQRGGYIVLE